MDGPPKFFRTPAEFRRWLKANHSKATEVWVGYHRVHTGKPTMTWSESVDEALCFGWIDGIRKRIDDESYKMRFTPRKLKSPWSKVNLAKYDVLLAEGRMTPAGTAAYERRIEAGYSYERDPVELDPAFVKTFKKQKKAWSFFNEQPPGYRKAVTDWVMRAKKQETRERRLAELIEESELGLRVGLYPTPPRRARGKLGS